jgi:dTDP-4-dehydrorhamnose reductase
MKNFLKIIVTGGSGRFGSVLKKTATNHKLLFPTKKKLNILKFNSCFKYLSKTKPDILIHAAGLSRPMDIHDLFINKSIDLNIIGTANIVKACSKLNIKLIYFSTSYVYPGINGNHKESDALYPINNYAWSKLGGECAVKMYKNSLILRASMTEKPFPHDQAFVDFKTNFIYHDTAAKILLKILKKKGVLNFGGEKKSVYNFVKENNPNIKKSFAKDLLPKKHPLNTAMNINKLKKILNK